RAGRRPGPAGRGEGDCPAADGGAARRRLSRAQPRLRQYDWIPGEAGGPSQPQQTPTSTRGGMTASLRQSFGEFGLGERSWERDGSLGEPVEGHGYFARLVLSILALERIVD